MNTDNEYQVNDRIIELMESLRYKPSDFSRSIDVIPSRITNIIQKKNKPNLEVVQKVLVNFRNINPYWLILGEGTMFRTGSGEVEAGQSEDEGGDAELRYLKQIVKQQEEMIGALKDHIATLKKEHYYSDGKKSKAG